MSPSYSEYGSNSTVTIYSSNEVSGISLLVVAGVISILAIFIGRLHYYLYARRRIVHSTNVVPYLTSLFVANIIQAIATIMNSRWLKKRIVVNDSFCSFQGGLKNAANVGIALWTFFIASHIFNLLFLRWRSTRVGMWATTIGGWSFVFTIVLLGPTIFQTAEKGPYFGVSGYWCWITDFYPHEQSFLEYFFEFLSAGVCFVIYMLVFVRVRGNLVKVKGQWRLRWIPRSDAWKLSFVRDMLDQSMFRVAATLVWYPVSYSIIIVPVALARFSSFTGHHVPFWATITTDVIFNLTGLVNSILLVTTQRVLPDISSLPDFSTPRKLDIDASGDGEASMSNGVIPFVLPPPPVLHRLDSHSANEHIYFTSPILKRASTADFVSNTSHL